MCGDPARLQRIAASLTAYGARFRPDSSIGRWHGARSPFWRGGALVDDLRTAVPRGAPLRIVRDRVETFRAWRVREGRRCGRLSVFATPRGPGRSGGARHRGARNRAPARSPRTRRGRRPGLRVRRVGGRCTGASRTGRGVRAGDRGAGAPSRRAPSSSGRCACVGRGAAAGWLSRARERLRSS